MATDMDQAYRGWTHEQLSDWNDSQEASAQFVDHGSISFGRFAAESLSWEKWSVFSHNKYQEELEKFMAPGLVAEKKAYFEEYYKGMRALKDLHQDQQAAPGLDTGDDCSICRQTEEQNSLQETVGDPVRNDVKMNQQMKADTSISSQGLKYSLHKATGEAENVISSCNPIAHAVLANKNSTSVSSIRSLAEDMSMELITSRSIKCTILEARRSSEVCH
ncbi:hypothetical protein AAC387_Pa01g0418 [Persea americana]